MAVATFGHHRRIVCDLSVGYDRNVYLGLEEVFELRLLNRLLHDGDIFVDCGANIGLWSIFGAYRVGANGRVIAIEPVATTFGRLDRNVNLSGFTHRVNLVNKALGRETGTVVALTGDVHNIMRIDASHSDAGVRATTTTLDELVAGARQVTGLKIDVEGYELDVLGGGESIIGQFAPWMFIEFNTDFARTVELRDWDVHTFLAERGYTAHLPRSLLAADYVPLPDGWRNPQRYSNLLYWPTSSAGAPRW